VIQQTPTFQPSAEQLREESQRLAAEEAERKAQEYWDPLLQLERTRAALIAGAEADADSGSDS
jgi:hypothetical protein